APTPGTVVYETVTTSACHAHSVYVITVDSDSLRAKSNTVDGSTCCSLYCYGGVRPGGVAESGVRLSRGEYIEYQLELGQPRPNPGVGVTMVDWSVPRALSGKVFDLSLFDVAGRRVSTIA